MILLRGISNWSNMAITLGRTFFSDDYGENFELPIVWVYGSVVISVFEMGNVSTTVSGTGVGTLTWTISQQPQYGTLTVNNSSSATSGDREDITVRYVVTSHNQSSDSFKIKLTDANGRTKTHTINVAITLLAISGTSSISLNEGTSATTTLITNRSSGNITWSLSGGCEICSSIYLDGGIVDVMKSYNQSVEIAYTAFFGDTGLLGSDTITVVAEDEAGNVANFNVVFTVNNLAPTPQDAVFFSSGPRRVEITFEEDLQSFSTDGTGFSVRASGGVPLEIVSSSCTGNDVVVVVLSLGTAVDVSYNATTASNVIKSLYDNSSAASFTDFAI